MSEAEKKNELAAAAGPAGAQSVEVLTNALRFEQEKNRILVAEVVALEDDLANRALEQFEGVVAVTYARQARFAAEGS